MAAMETSASGGGEGEFVREELPTEECLQRVKCPTCGKDTDLQCQHCSGPVSQKVVHVGSADHVSILEDGVFVRNTNRGSALGMLTRRDDGRVYISPLSSMIVEQTELKIPIPTSEGNDDAGADNTVSASVINDNNVLNEVDENMLMVNMDWKGIPEPQQQQEQQQQASATTTDTATDTGIAELCRKREIVLTKITTRSYKLFKKVLQEILKESPTREAVQILFRDFHLRLLGVTKGLEVLMEGDQDRVALLWHRAQDKEYIKRVLSQLVPAEERAQVTWREFSRHPVQCEDGPVVAAGHNIPVPAHPPQQEDPNNTATVNGALNYACKYGNSLTVKSLLAYPAARVGDLGRHGRSPFHFACLYCQPTVLDALHASGANVNARDSLGNTPLHLACGDGPGTDWDVTEEKRLSTVKWLLDHGAHPHLRTGQGQGQGQGEGQGQGLTAKELAMRAGNHSVAEMISSAKY